MAGWGPGPGWGYGPYGGMGGYGGGGPGFGGGPYGPPRPPGPMRPGFRPPGGGYGFNPYGGPPVSIFTPAGLFLCYSFCSLEQIDLSVKYIKFLVNFVEFCKPVFCNCARQWKHVLTNFDNPGSIRWVWWRTPAVWK